MSDELRPGVTFTDREQCEQTSRLTGLSEPASPFRAYACKIALPAGELPATPCAACGSFASGAELVNGKLVSLGMLPC